MAGVVLREDLRFEVDIGVEGIDLLSVLLRNDCRKFSVVFGVMDDALIGVFVLDDDDDFFGVSTNFCGAVTLFFLLLGLSIVETSS